MPQLLTASFFSFRPGMGQPVVTSLGVPKTMPDAKEWPVLHLLTPRWSYFHAEPDEFERQYLEQLDRFGPQKIARAVHQIANETGQDRLVLLCWEHDWDNCHRSLFADWLLQRTGELVCEILPPLPPGDRKAPDRKPGPLPGQVNPMLELDLGSV